MRNDLAMKLINMFERITKGITSINSDHSAIHKGWGAHAGDYFTLGNGASKAYCLTTPSVTYPHFKNLVFSGLGGSVKLEVIKNATVTANTGTTLAIVNPNHNSDTVPQMTIKESPTYSGGDVFEVVYALSDSTRQTTGNARIATSENQELVFKNGNEQYILKITNLTTDTVDVAWSSFWYEEPLGKS